ncbi:1946_t:CDS:2, partial [Racocetra persica]
MSLKMDNIECAKLEPNKQIGSGSSGDVELMKYNGKLIIRIGTAAAISEFDKLESPQGCKHIIDFYGWTNTPNHKIGLVTEYADGEDLHKYLIRNSLNDEEKEKMAGQISVGLAECHNHNIIHSDLKPENILVVIKNSKLLLKIADFSARTVLWAAPERLCKNELFKRYYDESQLPKLLELQNNYIKNPTLSDIYSYGLILWEIAMNGEEIYEEQNNNIEKVMKIKACGNIDDLISKLSEQECPKNLETLIRKCCTFNPENRLQKIKE